MESYFASKIRELAVREGLNYDDTLSNEKSWYNGYRFEEGSETVYNPVRLSIVFLHKVSHYWFETGTPSFFLDLMRKQEYDIVACLQESVTELSFSAYDVDLISPTPLLIQIGYLTIIWSEHDGDTRLYQL